MKLRLAGSHGSLSGFLLLPRHALPWCGDCWPFGPHNQMEKDFPLGQVQGRILIGWAWIWYPSLDQSLWLLWSHTSSLWRGGGACARRRKRRGAEQTRADGAPGELLQPWRQARHRVHAGSLSVAWWAESFSEASERRFLPSLPAPHLSGFCYFLVPGIYLTLKSSNVHM